MQSEIHSTLKQIANLDWATIYSKYQEKRYILSREDFIEEEIKPLLGFPLTPHQFSYHLSKFKKKNITNQESSIITTTPLRKSNAAVKVFDHINCAPIRSHSISIDIDGLGTININGDNPEQSVAKIIGYLKSQEMEEC